MKTTLETLLEQLGVFFLCLLSCHGLKKIKEKDDLDSGTRTSDR